MPMLTHRHKNARSDSTDTTAEPVSIVAANVTTTTVAAAANHFSCSLSSPEDRANLTITTVTLTSVAPSKTITTGPAKEFPDSLNGCDQPSVADSSAAISTKAKHP